MINPNKLRLHVLDMVYKKKTGHIGGAFSIAELIAYLYSTSDLTSDNGDKLVLSKGHAVPIVYAALYELGKIISLDSFREINSELQGHPDRRRCKYMHATTGSLGQGLSIAIGQAMAMKINKSNKMVYCVIGDGECSEGQIFEAAMFAPRMGLGNLICFIDANGKQCDGDALVKSSSVLECFAQLGWRVMAINGNDMSSVSDAVDSCRYQFSDELPKCVLLRTQKGAGVSFMTEDYGWHSRVPTEEEYNVAKEELEAKINVRK